MTTTIQNNHCKEYTTSKPYTCSWNWNNQESNNKKPHITHDTMNIFISKYYLSTKSSQLLQDGKTNSHTHAFLLAEPTYTNQISDTPYKSCNHVDVLAHLPMQYHVWQ